MLPIAFVTCNRAIPAGVTVFLDYAIHELVHDPNAVEVRIPVLLPLAVRGVEKPSDVSVQQILPLIEIK